MNIQTKPQPYMNSYLAGVGLGVVLFLSFFIMGRGLGASGAFSSVLSNGLHLIAPQHVENNHYFSEYAGPEGTGLKDWLVFEVIGVVIGGFLSGLFAGRLKLETNHGPRVTAKQRWLFAFLGGSLMGFGAKLARGCTSGQALSGGAMLSVGAWAFMFCIFGAGYMIAYFVRRLWI
jgi:hypothetical protein